MNNHEQKQPHSRRSFLGSLATGAAALGVASIGSPLPAAAAPVFSPADPESIFASLNGKHRMVFDATRPHEIFPFAWPKVFLLTNAGTGTAEKDCNAVVVLRHDAIIYALPDSMWAKYKFGEHFKADDPKTKAPSVRNPFWQPKQGDFKVPGIGEVAIGINDLQASGVVFVVCDMALTVNSAVMGMQTGTDGAAVKKEWLDNLLPGVKVVPSGVWAVGRAQEHGCGYCFVG